MNRNCIWLISTIALLVLAACSSNQSSSNTMASAPSTTASSPASKEMKAAPTTSTSDQTQAGFTGLKNVLAKTKNDVEASNFTKAKEEFGEFEEYWEKVEDGVKAKSASTYKTIENDMDNITNGLRASQPNKTKILADLQSLSKTLNSYQ